MKKSVKGVLVALAVIACAVLALKGSVLIVQSGSWSQTGNLSSARVGASAALLPDGRILVAGGDPGTGPVATVDFFATDGTISAAPPMINARSQHASVALQDGRVLVAGGLTFGGSVTNAAEIYDPVANSWTSVGAGMIEARSGATAAVLQDGRVAIAGGQNGTVISSTIEIFDPAHGTFTSAGMMSSPRTQHAMAVLLDGRVLIVGGNSGTTGTPPEPTPVASTDIFDPVAGAVSAGPSLATARYNHSATTLLNGQVVVIGGNNGNTNPAQMDVTPAELIDFTAATPAFTTLSTNLATPREGHLAFLLPNNNNVLIVGGTSAGTTIASAELLTAQGAPPSVWTYSFGPTGTMTAARSSAAGSANQVNATSTVMQRNGVLMVGGGADANGNSLISTEAYGYATVQTDASEYAPGSPVTITGSGWVPGETVTLSFLESPYFDTHPTLTAVADANGNISNNQFSPDLHDIGIMFFLTATGSVSQAQNRFADATNASSGDGTMTVSPTTLTAGSTGNTLTFTFTSPNGGSFNSGSQGTIQVPAGWTTPTSSNVSVSVGPSPNCTTATLGTITGTGPWTIPINMTCPAKDQFTVTYSGVAAPTTAGSNTFTTQTKQNAGTLTTITSGSPVVTVTAGAAAQLALSGLTTNLTSGSTRVLTATIQDANGNTVTTGSDSTLSVTFAQTAGTGSVTGLGSSTAAAGVATLTVTGDLVGSVTITASATGSKGALTVGTGNPITFTVVAGAATKYLVTSSNNSPVAGTAVTITAQLADTNGNPVSTSGKTVTWTKTGSGGSFSPPTSATNGSGVATVTFTTGTTVTTYTVTATDNTNVTGTSGNITTVTGTATQYLVTSSNNSPVAGAAVTITAQLADANGNPVSTSGKTVTWSKTGSGGSFSPPTSATNGSGVATVTFTTGTTVTTYTVTATDNTNVTGTSGNITTVAGPATQLAFGQQPTNTVSGVSISPVTVQVEDQFGNVLTSDTGSFNINIAISANPGGGTLSGTTAVKDTNGVSTFSNLSINKAGAGYSLIANSAGMKVTSSLFNITAAAASQLVFLQQPTATAAGSTMTPAVTVQIEDQFGNVTTTGSDSTRTVSLAIGNNPSSGTLTGGAAVAASSGVATFSSLSINNPGTGYTLVATSAGLTNPTVTSGAFNINAANGSGTMTVSPTSANAGSTANSFTFTFTANSGNFPSGSQVTLLVPAGWTQPTTAAGAGNVVVANSSGTSCAPSIGTITGSGPWTIPISMTCNSGNSFTLTYSGVTAPTPSATTAYTFTTQSKDAAGGTLTAIASSPVVTVNAVSQLGFATAPLTSVVGQCAGPITVQTQNSTGTALDPASPVQVDLSIVSGGSGGFYSDGACSTAISSTSILSSANSASFYFKGTSPGSPTTIKAADHAGVLTAATQNETVNQATTSTLVTSSASPSVFGQSVIFTATVTAVAPGTGTPTGIVTFKDGTTTLGTGTLNGSGVATYTTTAGQLATGSNSITAVYSGDTNFTTSTGTLTQTVNQASTSTTLVSSLNPSFFGQQVTFTATVSSASGTPTGAVNFFDGTNQIGTGTLSLIGGNDIATFSTSSLAVATHTITAQYVSDGNFSGSTSNAVSQQVINAATTTTVTSSANPSVFGQGVSFTATVTAQQPGLGPVTGMVQFSIDGSPYGNPVTLNNGSATIGPISNLSVGAAGHPVTATYSPATGSVYQPSSGSLPQVVNQDGTTTMVMSLSNPSAFGQPVNVTVAVAPAASGSGTPTGTVSFIIDGAPAIVLTLVGGSATTSTSSLSVGSHTFTANYSGDGNFTTSMASATQVVSQATTSTALMLNPSTINFGESTTVTATVTDASMGSTGTPTGTVTVSDGIGNAAGDSCTITLSSGTGTCVLAPSATAPGGSTVAGTYSGDPNFQASTVTTSLIVNAATTTTTLNTSSPNGSTLGQAVAFTATVMDSSSGDSAVPTGVVLFYDTVGGNTTLIGSASLNAGNATFTTALLSFSASPHSITATFIGNADFSASMTSSPVSQTVKPRSTSTAVVLSPMQVVVGQPSTATVTVTDTPPVTPAGIPGAFALTSQSLNVGRTGHAAALLPNGTVLIAGGVDKNGAVLTSAEIYDPMAGTFTTLIATLDTPRTGATATLLNNGTVLIAGGSSDGSTARASAEIFDPVAGTFTPLTASLSTPRFGHTATLLPSGKVLIAGGQSGSATLNTMEVFDPSVPSFTAIGDTLSVARMGHTATPLFNGTILFAGGSGLTSAEIYDPVAHTSTPLTSNMTTDRTNHAAALLPDGNVLIAGGTSSSNSGNAVNSTELYNTSAGIFTAATKMNAARSGLTATMLDSAQVLVVGGSNSTYPALASAELYTPSFDPLGTVSVTSNDDTDGITGAPCTLILNGTGSTTCQVTDTPTQAGTGTHTLTGTYTAASDSVHTASSGSANLTVIKADSLTTVTSSPSSSVFGQSVTFSAAVTAVAPGTGAPTGTVQFVVDGSNYGSPVSLTGASASITDSALAVAPHSITASYSGDSNFNKTGFDAGSTATTATQTVKPAPTSTTVTSSANPSTFGQSVTFTATVMNTAGAGVSTATPTGSVRFYIDGTAFGSPVAVAGSGATATGTSGATATLTVNGSPHTIRATYTNSDGNFSGSYGLLSGGQTVQPAPTSTSVSSSQNPSIFGQSVTFTATVTNAAGAAISTATPTGSVQFYIDGTAFGSPVPVSGSGAMATGASSATAALIVSGSPHTIKATFTNSDGNFSGSYGSVSQTVQPAPTSTSVSSSQNSSTYGQPVKFTATVMNIAGAGVSTATPTGSVQFYIDGSAFGSPVALASGGATTAAVSALMVTGSPHSVMANYVSADGNFSNSNGALTGGQAVTPASLTITASSGSMIYGGPVSPITASYSGFVNLEGAANLTTQPSCGTLATSSSPVGMYASMCSGAFDPNYTIMYSAGIVTVTPATTTTIVASSSPLVNGVPTSTFMQLVTFTATVTPQFSGTPTGTVTFQDTVNGTTATLGTAPLSVVNGLDIATFSTASLQDASPNIITAVYSGDSAGNGDGLGDFLRSTSSAITQTVEPSPNVSLSPLFVSFGNLNVGQKSGPATVTLSNIGDATLNISVNGISITQPSTDFTQTNNCPAALGFTAPNNSCTITITFAPVDTGVRTASLQITDNDDDSPNAQQIVSLTGAGLSTITGSSLFTDAIFATANGCGSIVESGGSTVDSFNSGLGLFGPSNHEFSGGNVGTNGNVSLNGSKTTIYGSAAVDSMTTGNCSKTSQTGVTTSGGAQVTGPPADGLVALNGPISYPAPPAPNPVPPTTNQNISDSCGSVSGCMPSAGTKTVSLIPGQYGNLTMSGGTIAHVSKGTYNVNSLTLSGNSILYVDSGPVVVNLAGASLSKGNPAMDTSGGSIQNPSGIPANLQFTYAGSQGLNLSGGSDSYATVYAPNAFVNMSGGSDFWGSIIASTVTSSGGTAIHYDTNLPNIQAGNYIWFSAVVNNVQYNGNPITSKAGQIKLYLTFSSISFTANGTSYSVPVPNAVVTLNSASQASGAKTTYDLTNSRWSTAVAPTALTGNTFVTGVAVPVQAGGFPTGIQNVSFQAAFSTDAPGVTLQWQWGAAVYGSAVSAACSSIGPSGACSPSTYATTTPNNPNVLGVNPEDGSADAYGTDPAGTPEIYKADVIFGATGGGGTNYTGYLSTAAGVVPTIAPMSVSPSSLDFGGQSQGTTSAPPLTTVLTNNDSVSHTIYSLSVVGTDAGDFTLVPSGLTTPNNCVSMPILAYGASCTLYVTFTPGDVGTRTAKIVVNDDANNSPQTVYLSGTGQ